MERGKILGRESMIVDKTETDKDSDKSHCV